MGNRRKLYYGAQYFRPPSPKRENHKRYLEQIKHELEFDVIKIWYCWNRCHVEPDRFDFDEYDEMLTICDDLDLKVIINTILEDAPYWLETAHPESRYVNSNQVPDILSGNATRPTGGHPGLCLDHSLVVEQAGRFLTRLANRAKTRPSLLGYDCWNEPHIPPSRSTNFWATGADMLYCYCPASIRCFRQWLKSRYKTLDALNDTWQYYYGDWDQINPPHRHGSFPDWLDWWRFWFDNLQQQITWRTDTLKAADPDHFVMSHSGGTPPLMPRIQAGINSYSLAKGVDVWGASIPPRALNWTTGMTAGALEFTRSAACGKDFWISELQAGYTPTLGMRKFPRPEPRHIRSWNWLAAVYGAKGIMYWAYMTERTGIEAQSSGLVRLNAEMTDRSEAAAESYRMLRKYEHIFADRVPESDVAILYDPDSSTILFAQTGNDQWICSSHVSYYQIVWNADLHARWVSFEMLDTVKEKVLIVPMHYLLTPEAAAALRSYVEAGGTLIAENSLGAFDPNGMLHEQIPPYDLAEVFGLVEEENFYTWPDYESTFVDPVVTVAQGFFRDFSGPYHDEIYNGPEIALSAPVEARFAAHGFLTPLRLTTAKSLGGWNGHCLAAFNQFGKGQAYYFGTFLGLAMFYGHPAAGAAISSILNQTLEPKVTGTTLRPRLVDNGKEALLAVFNDGRKDTHTDTITLPPRFTCATDVYTEQAVPIRDGAIEVSVGREDVAVLHLRA